MQGLLGLVTLFCLYRVNNLLIILNNKYISWYILLITILNYVYNQVNKTEEQL